MLQELQRWFPESLRRSFLPTAEKTSDVQENDKDVQENDTNLARAPLFDSSFDFRLQLPCLADSAHAENPSMRIRSLYGGESQLTVIEKYSLHFSQGKIKLVRNMQGFELADLE